MSDLVSATEQAIAAATHLTAMDEGSVEALRALARKIDAWDEIVAFALDDVAGSSARPRVPANDNTSLPTYLKYAESLGLTPMGRSRATIEAAKKGGPVGTLGKLQGITGGKGA